MNLFYQPLIKEGIYYLDEEESRHCIKVLRHTSGDTIHITDGKGSFYDALITKDDPRKCSFSIMKETVAPSPSFTIHIAISPTKNTDRIEWFVEKCVEFGVNTITLLDCENTERSFIKIDRLQKVVISAMKQSLKAWLPEIKPLQNFSSFIKQATEIQKFIAYVDKENPTQLQNIAGKGTSYVILIGPEGDFSLDELALAIQRDFIKVSLGPSRLRTETAGIAACHILNLINS